MRLKRLFTPLEIKRQCTTKRSPQSDLSLTGFSWLFVFGIVFCLCNPVSAKTVEEELIELKSRIAALEQKLAAQEEKLGKQEEVQDELAKIKEAFEGFSISAGATFILQGTNNANGEDLSKNGEDVTDASYSVDLEIEKEFSDYGKAYLHFEGGNGDGVTDELQLFNNVNADATGEENFDLIEAWYEHYFKSVPLTITFGKIDPTCYIDANEYANDETTQFLGNVFKNSPTIEFPDNSAGIRLAIEPADFLGIEFVAMDANADWEDIFDNIFLTGQLDFKPKLLERPGNYRVYGWLNDKDHTKWSDASKTKEKSYGFGLSFDQEITDVLGMFARYGWQDPESYAEDADFSLEHSWSIGFQLAGSLWGRDDDVFAVAFGQVIPSDDYKNATNRKADSEEHLEAYYSFKVNEHLTVSPDLQVIWDPYGGDATNGNSTITVVGMRAQVDF